jgi:outer membrane murein-binding lipoprotein Lpp
MINQSTPMLAAVVLGVSLLAGTAPANAEIKVRTIKFAMQNTAGSAQYDAAV